MKSNFKWFKKLSLKFVIFGSCLTFFTSCTFVYARGLLGLKKLKPQSELNQLTYIQNTVRYPGYYYTADSAYAEFLSKFDTTSAYEKRLLNKYIQPLSVFCYNNKTGEQVANFANCDGNPRGITNLTWNKEGQLDVFPPKYKVYDIDSISATEVLSYIKPLANSTAVPDNWITSSEWTLIIFWTKFMGRQNTNFLMEVSRTISHIPHSYTLVYVELDNAFAKFGEVKF